MRITADENMPALGLFTPLGEVTRCAGRGLTRADLAETEVLLVRSVTRVDAALLAGTPVRFVGSATIGTDHVDTAWLARAGIGFAHAPGCNAMAVAEYVLQAVLDWACEQGRALEELSVGVVGVGNAGGRVAGLLTAAGCRVQGCDPPRAAAGERMSGGLAPDQPLDESLDNLLGCDVITLHVPLTVEGPHATHHLLDASALARVGPAQLLVNSSRGPVIDNAALLQRLTSGDGPSVVLDVWEQEPVVPAALIRAVRYGTPHIAGYSVEGRTRGSLMVYQALCDYLQRRGQEVAELPERKHTVLARDVNVASDVLDVLRHRWDMRRAHAALCNAIISGQGAEGFDHLRKEASFRHELAGLALHGCIGDRWLPLMTLLGVTQKT